MLAIYAGHGKGEVDAGEICKSEVRC
jgi:hypothetical protein